MSSQVGDVLVVADLSVVIRHCPDSDDPRTQTTSSRLAVWGARGPGAPLDAALASSSSAARTREGAIAKKPDSFVRSAWKVPPTPLTFHFMLNIPHVQFHLIII